MQQADNDTGVWLLPHSCAQRLRLLSVAEAEAEAEVEVEVEG